MKYRKKPIVIEAEQFYPCDWKRIKGVQRKIDHEVMGFPIEIFYIQTLEGDMDIRPGDWVITGIEGERYPCKDSIFKSTYEEVE